LESIRRDPATPIADLRRALVCTGCGQKGPPAVTIRGVATRADPLPDVLVITLPPDEDTPPSITTITMDI